MKYIFIAILALLTAPAWAAPSVPSIHDVYTAATTGHLEQAQSEINQVLAAYPNSGKAHYVDARVLALEGQWAQAANQLELAQRLDPGLPFERQADLQAFQRQIAAHTGHAANAGSPIPMGTVIGGALGLLAVLMLIAVYRRSRRPQPVQVMPAGWPNPSAPAGFGAQPGAYPQPGGGGSGGFLGAVGTGIGMGAGFAAGEMLVDKLFDHNNTGMGQGGGFMPNADASQALPDDQDFGVNDAGSWSDDSGGGGMDDSGGWN
jgi:hypothetical protein